MNLRALALDPDFDPVDYLRRVAPGRKLQMDEDAIDFVIAAWREEGQWHVSRIPKRNGLTCEQLLTALAAHPAEGGTLGFVSVAEDFFVVVRTGSQRARMLLSDVTAAPEWPIAADVLEYLDIPEPADDELDDIEPAGDLTIVADLGMPAAELAMLVEDVDLYPDEVLATVAKRLGFGPAFENLLDPIA